MLKIEASEFAHLTPHGLNLKFHFTLASELPRIPTPFISEFFLIRPYFTKNGLSLIRDNHCSLIFYYSCMDQKLFASNPKNCRKFQISNLEIQNKEHVTDRSSGLICQLSLARSRFWLEERV